MQCGLLGRKLGHSYSPQIHSHLGDYSYSLYEKEPEELAQFLRSGDFSGLNVTIPYKKEVIPLLDELTSIARKLGAVNTVVRREDGSLLGHNTDYFGFRSLVEHSGVAVANRKVLVLGTGGASNTAAAVLTELGAQVVTISRSGPHNYSNLWLHSDATLIVNTTPVGMYPHTGAAPLDIRRFPKLEGVLDVVYNPARTQLLLDAEQLGLPWANGLWMLVAQAKESAEYFLGKAIPDSVIDPIYRGLRRQMENMVLIGMPGCGKTTIAQALAAHTGRTVADCDAQILSLAGKSIPEIFAQDGEEAFRAYETQVLGELGKQSGLILATGGGCVTRERNYPLLHQNGQLILLERAVDKLPTVGRPLSQASPLEAIYQSRKPFYAAFSDIRIDNNDTVEATVSSILAAWEELL